MAEYTELNPYQKPEAELEVPGDDSEEMERLAAAQKLVLYAILFYVIGIFSPSFIAAINPRLLPVVGTLVPLLVFAAALISLVGIVRLSGALGHSIVVRILLFILMFVPLINLLTLLMLNSRASARLRDGGYRVGLMGASKVH